jgi:hypothetical protein
LPSFITSSPKTAPRAAELSPSERAALPVSVRNKVESLVMPAYAYHARMTAFGFVSGLVLVLPLVLWQTGRFGDIGSRYILRPPGVTKPVASAIPASVVAGATSPVPVLLSAPRPAERPAPPPDPEAVSQRDAMLAKLESARGLINDGDVLRAREVLADGDVASEAEAVYLLAETYDPNVLAALGLVNVRAEVERARRLYEQALASGYEGAKLRLDNLK